MAGIRRYSLELPGDIRDKRTIDGSQACPPVIRKGVPQLPDNVRSARNVSRVVEDRIAEKNDVRMLDAHLDLAR